MGLAERVAARRRGAVLGTGALLVVVTGLYLGTEVPLGLLLVQVLVVGLAVGVAEVGLNTLPAFERLEQLAATLGRWASTGDVSQRLGSIDDREVARLAQAINALLDTIESQHAALADGGRSEVLDRSPFAVVVVEPSGLVGYLNDAARQMLELRGDPLDKQPIEGIAVAEIHEVVSAVRDGIDVGEVTCTSGAYDLSVRSLPTREGGALVFAYDVTRFRKAEQARTTFVANVSHELRTPVTAIMGYAETLMAEPESIPEDVLPLVEAIFRNTRRLRDLFEDLLVLHRIEARHRQLPLERRKLLPIIQEAVLSAADTAAQRGQDFSVHCDPDIEAYVHQEALEGILGNLASNACKYTPESGSVRVVVHQADDEVRVDVEDNGIGIDPIHHERIFERFYRVDVGRSRRAGGTGLGLAIVKHLALASRCRVSMRSEQGRGSTFSVHLPLGEATAR